MPGVPRVAWHCVAVSVGGWSVAGVISAVGMILSFLVVLKILTERRDASATLAWILAIILVPYLGPVLYFVLAGRVERRRIRRRERALLQLEDGRRAAERHLREHAAGADEEVHPDQRGIMRLAEELGAGPPLVGNHVSFLPDGRDTFDLIEEAIQNAVHHVHLEYYIFRPDETGVRLLQLLERKAREGVSVRLLYDAVGSASLGRRHLRGLVAAGGRAEAFLPMFSLRRPFGINFRTHRKIVVVDDAVGFVGGRNVGDEYRLGVSKFGEWHDAHLRIAGPAVHRLQEIFAEDWIFASGEDVTLHAECFTPFTRPGRARIQVIESGPDGGRETIHRVVFQAIVSARETLDMVTPYFVPDRSIQVALENAALRGVRVRLLVPGVSDNPLVSWAARSYYRELIPAGVEVYRFRPGMHHAKLMVADGRWAYVGTANMDIRSFRLNFEVGLSIYEPDIARAIVQSIEEDLGRSESFTMDRAGRGELLAEGLGRMLSPVL